MTAAAKKMKTGKGSAVTTKTNSKSNHRRSDHVDDPIDEPQPPPPTKKAKKHAAAAASAATTTTTTTTTTAADDDTNNSATTEGGDATRNDSTTAAAAAPLLRCAGCGLAECDASTGPLLLFEDPEEQQHQQQQQQDEEKRYCASCMTGKKVRVYWPVDSQWYIADVQQYDSRTGEHLLRYPDGDTEWVRIGEDHTTSNTQYKEYYNTTTTTRNHHVNNDASSSAEELTRLPSLGGGVSFALSNMSQSFGLHSVAGEEDEEDDDNDNVEDNNAAAGVVVDGNNEKTMHLKPPSSQQQQHHRMYQQLNLDRTASSMSSFGMFGGGGGIGAGAGGGGATAAAAPTNYQILAPNYTHSFSSKIGAAPSMEFYPPPPQPYPHHHTAGGRTGVPYSHAPPPPPHPSHNIQQPPPNHPYPNQSYYEEHHRGQHHHHHHHHPNPIIYPYQGGGGGGVSQQQLQHPLPPMSKSPGQHSSTTSPSSKQQQQQKRRLPLSPSKPSIKKATTTTNTIKGGHTPTTIGSSTFSSSSSAAKTRKALPTAWAPSEDEHLLDLVLQMQHPLKWSVIAESLSNIMASTDSRMPPRTGKQCRERYVNHLNPRLKNTDFTPMEDATIWHLYGTIGSQWAKMSKVIPGRTDNNLKNRFHNLKRQLYREEDARQRITVEEFAEMMKKRKNTNGTTMVYSSIEKVHRDIPKFLRTKIEDMWNYKRHIGMVAANSNSGIDGGGSSSSSSNTAIVQESREEVEVKEEEKDTSGNGSDSADAMESSSSPTTTTTQPPLSSGGESSSSSSRHRKFGPYEAVVEPTQCGRCGLFAPSVQCGNEICTKTRWCQVCTRVSLHLTGNVLRECMNLRKSQEEEMARGLEKLLMNIM